MSVTDRQTHRRIDIGNIVHVQRVCLWRLLFRSACLPHRFHGCCCYSAAVSRSLVLRLFRHYVLIVGKMIQFSVESIFDRRCTVRSIDADLAPAAAAMHAPGSTLRAVQSGLMLRLRLLPWRSRMTMMTKCLSLLHGTERCSGIFAVSESGEPPRLVTNPRLRPKNINVSGNPTDRGFYSTLIFVEPWAEISVLEQHCLFDAGQTTHVQ